MVHASNNMELGRIREFFDGAFADEGGVLQVRFSPGGDSNILTVAGHGVFKVLRVEDLGLKNVQHSLTKRDSTVFTAHSWITGAVLFCACLVSLDNFIKKFLSYMDRTTEQL